MSNIIGIVEQQCDPDPISALETQLWETHRVHGALRAVQSLVQPGTACDERLEVQCLRRQDLAHLLEVLQCNLGDHLQALQCTVATLRPRAQQGRTR